jgi:hypothetical protein
VVEEVAFELTFTSEGSKTFSKVPTILSGPPGMPLKTSLT